VSGCWFQWHAYYRFHQHVKKRFIRSRAQEVVSTRMMVSHQGENLSVVVYQPAHSSLHAPRLCSCRLDGTRWPVWELCSSAGFTWVCRGCAWVVWYFYQRYWISPNASIIADWLITVHGVDAKKIGIAGHSMVERMPYLPLPRIAFSLVWLLLIPMTMVRYLWCMVYSLICAYLCYLLCGGRLAGFQRLCANVD